MRTAGQLYQILLDKFDELYHFGICSLMEHCEEMEYITIRERLRLFKHFQEQKPGKYSWRGWFTNYYGGIYWWPEEEIKNRKKFLKMLIKKYKNTII